MAPLPDRHSTPRPSSRPTTSAVGGLRAQRAGEAWMEVKEAGGHVCGSWAGGAQTAGEGLSIGPETEVKEAGGHG